MFMSSFMILTINPFNNRSSILFRASGNTIIVAYFVYGNGSALTSAEVEKMLSDPEHYLILGQLGLKNIVCMQVLILKYCQGVLPIVDLTVYIYL